MQGTCKIFGVQQSFYVSYYPQSTGIVERMNRTIKCTIAKMLLDNVNTWADAVPYALMNVRRMTASPKQHSPFELMIERKITACVLT